MNRDKLKARLKALEEEAEMVRMEIKLIESTKGTCTLFCDKVTYNIERDDLYDKLSMIDDDIREIWYKLTPEPETITIQFPERW